MYCSLDLALGNVCKLLIMLSCSLSCFCLVIWRKRLLLHLGKRGKSRVSSQGQTQSLLAVEVISQGQLCPKIIIKWLHKDRHEWDMSQNSMKSMNLVLMCHCQMLCPTLWVLSWNLIMMVLDSGDTVTELRPESCHVFLCHEDRVEVSSVILRQTLTT